MDHSVYVNAMQDSTESLLFIMLDLCPDVKMLTCICMVVIFQYCHYVEKIKCFTVIEHMCFCLNYSVLKRLPTL